MRGVCLTYTPYRVNNQYPFSFISIKNCWSLRIHTSDVKLVSFLLYLTSIKSSNISEISLIHSSASFCLNRFSSNSNSGHNAPPSPIPATMNTNRSNTKQYTYIFASCTVLHAHTPNGREFKTSATVCHEKGFLNAGLSVSWNNVVCRVLFFSDKQMLCCLDITEHCLLRKAKKKTVSPVPLSYTNAGSYGH